MAERPVTDWRDAAQQRGRRRSPRAPTTQVVSLPLYPTLTEAEQDRVIDALERVL